MAETVLIVDDEESVRRTFVEWLRASDLPVTLKAVADAEAALQFANANPVDLAILDWNLGSGNDGLQLLEDLVVFQPSVVAILVTGFAHQATPLQALRMGVRDYLDKNQDLTREAFLTSVRKQLDFIRPAKRERRFHDSLLLFRETVEKVLPVVRSTATLQGSGSQWDAFKPYLNLAKEILGSSKAWLIWRDQAETSVLSAEGQTHAWVAEQFPKSLASAALVSGSKSRVATAEAEGSGMILLQPFEKGVAELLAIPLIGESNFQAVLELGFAKAGGEPRDKKNIDLFAALGAELAIRCFNERRHAQVLEAALEGARQASSSLLEESPACPETITPVDQRVINRMATALATDTKFAKETLRIAQRIRDLNEKHGSAALRHADRLLELTEELMNEMNPPLRD